MYNVKGPSKIVSKTRRGLPQNLDNFNKEHSKNHNNNNNNNDNNHKSNCENDKVINGPKPVFQKTYKRHNNKHHNNNNNVDGHNVMTPQHEEIIKYIHESWNCIFSESDANSLDSGSGTESDYSSTAVYYEDQPVPAALENFKPFDLESFWGKRLFTYITNSVNTN